MKRPLHSVVSILFVCYLTGPVAAFAEDELSDSGMDKSGRGLVFSVLNYGVASASVDGYNTPFVLEPMSLQYNIFDYFGLVLRNRLYEDFRTLHSPTVSLSLKGYSYGLALQYPLHRYFIPFLRYEQFHWDMEAQVLDQNIGKTSGISPMYSLGVMIMLGDSGLGISLQQTRIYELSDTNTTENTMGFIYHF